MKVVIQRVTQASVEIEQRTHASIRTGLLILLGISKQDSLEDADYLCDKIIGLRIFPDDAGKMNRSVQQAGGALLIVSQFTLYADTRRGRRPGFDAAAPPDRAVELYQYFVDKARSGSVPVHTGVFQASMKVQLINDGPVTIIIDSAERKR